MQADFINTIFLKRHQTIKRKYKKTRQLNLHLNESIRYAKRIQDAMMKKERHLQNLFEDSFILNIPKDTVTGDFYWFSKIPPRYINNKFFK